MKTASALLLAILLGCQPIPPVTPGPDASDAAVYTVDVAPADAGVYAACCEKMGDTSPNCASLLAQNAARPTFPFPKACSLCGLSCP